MKLISKAVLFFALGFLSTPIAAQEVDVSKIKEKYWAMGEEAELGVIQNRQFKKGKRIQIALFGSRVLADPFLDISNIGVGLGYHFTEYWMAEAVYWKDFAQSSTALQTLEKSLAGATANTNIPRQYYGLESTYSALYGKLSVLGSSIIYYDLFLRGGLGISETETGKYFTPSMGVGQRIFLGRYLSLNVDYRLRFFRERLTEKAIPSQLGNVVGERDNFNHSVSIGVSVLFGEL